MTRNADMHVGLLDAGSDIQFHVFPIYRT